MQIIEEPVEVGEVSVALRVDEHDFKKAYLAPSGEQLAFRTENDYVRVLVPKVNGYQMVVFE